MLNSESNFLFSTGKVFYPYEIEQSLRFNDNDTPYLNNVFSSSGDRKTWTYSFWYKSSVSGLSARFIEGYSSSSEWTTFRITPTGSLAFSYYNTSLLVDVDIVNLLRDTSAWYHIVCVVDTTQATDSDRIKFYINGVRQTNYGTTTWPSLNQQLTVNSNVSHNISRFQTDNTNNIDGYLAETHFIDGQALSPTDFGEFKNNVWIPKAYEGTYGTNGFYLDYSNGADIGADYSGNANDFTATNLAATDVMLDSPTNNFCTLNPNNYRRGFSAGDTIYQEGNLQVRHDDTINASLNSATMGVSSGKYYFEFVMTVDGGVVRVGVHEGDQDLAGEGTLYRDTGEQWVDGSESAYGSSYNTTDIVGVAVDADSGEVTFYLNNSSQGTITTLSPSPAIPLSYADKGTTLVFNFGQDSSFAGNKTRQGNTDSNGIGDFYYAPPSGYLALCTANLPEPAISPLNGEDPSDYFNTVTYTGNGSTQSISGVGFQSDLTWIKNRAAADSHVWTDIIRGVGEILSSDSTAAESTDSDTVTSFDSDGFSLGADVKVNTNTESYVAWNWLADNTTGSSNTDGTITSTVSANTTSGFSIVSYTGNGSSGSTVGHGLGVKPDIVIIKRRSNTASWLVVTDVIDGSADFLYLDLTDAKTDSATLSLDTDTFTVSSGTSNNGSGDDYIAYCFASVEGFSKVGVYTGNGSSDGPFVYTGFRPARSMIKRTSLSGTNWGIRDNIRNEYNPEIKNLKANSSDAEADATGEPIDFLSNGIKLRGTASNINTSSETYLYIIFAEMPFKYTNAR